ncbi:MAG: DUF1697 domain-containing protein [Woeseiaceae bacterium]
MKTWVALLRGVNVGGRNSLPMKSLSQILGSAGCEQVKTYIQSGNVVFKGEVKSVARFSEEIGREIEKEHGFCPTVQLIGADELGQAIVSNPYPQATGEPQTLHLFFLERPPQEDRVSAAQAFLSETESFTVLGHLLYLHAPDGIGRSKFAGGIERVLRVKMTGRNWRTIGKLGELASSIE